MPSGSGAMCAEYFSSATWSAGMRAANDGLTMGSSGRGEGRRPKWPLRLHDDARPRGAADADFHLRLEADAREPEPAACRRRLFLHGPQVVPERVGLAVHRVDPPAQAQV